MSLSIRLALPPCTVTPPPKLGSGPPSILFAMMLLDRSTAPDTFSSITPPPLDPESPSTWLSSITLWIAISRPSCRSLYTTNLPPEIRGTNVDVTVRSNDSDVKSGKSSASSPR